MPESNGLLARLVRLLASTPPAAKGALVVALALVVTFVMIEGTVYPFNGLTHYRGGSYSDVGQSVWNLWWTAESILSLRNPLYTDLVFHPIGAELGTHTLSAGYVPISLLAKLLSGGSPMYPIYAYNVTTLLAYAALLLFSFLTLREVGFGLAASLIPALGYAFSDFYTLHWLHLNLLGGFTLPLVAWLVVRLWKRPTPGRLLAVALAAAWSVYITEFALSIVMAALLFLLLALVPGGLRRAVAARARDLGAANIALAAAIFGLLAAPLVISFFRADALPPGEFQFSYNSANVATLFVPSADSTHLYGRLFVPLEDRITSGRLAATTFLGFPVILAVLLGLWRLRSALAWIAVAVAAFFLVLSFGPTLQVFSTDTGIRMPYAWLMQIPPFTQNRCPARFVAMAHFFLLFCSAAGLSWILGLLERRAHAGLAAAFAVAMIAWTVAECWAPPYGPHVRYAPPTAKLARLVPGPVVHSSMTGRGCNDALLQVFHGHPTANGCLARVTLAQSSRVEAIRNAMMKRDWERYTLLLKSAGFTNIILDMRYSPQMKEGFKSLPFNIVDLAE
jgi:hypothetical protein